MGASAESERAVISPAALTAPLQTAALYVGDLDPTVDESDLAVAFAGFGIRPEFVRVCRDRVTGGSLRYAYINFPSFALADSAMRTMKYSILKGKTMRIMWSVRDPLMRKNGVGNLFVKNLEEWIGASELEALFKEYGTVVSCKVALDENGNSKGFGFVQMENKESAKSAIVALHGAILNCGTKELYVSNFTKKNQMQALLPQGRKSTNLYIKNLEPDVTDDLLRAKFSEFGQVCSAVVMKDELGKSRGFGFVTFELLEQAMRAMKAMNGSILGSKTIYIGFAQKKAERRELLKMHFSENHGGDFPKKIQGSNVYVKYLDDSVDDKALQDFFNLCGKVVSAKVMQQPNGMSKGFGFVSFSSPEEARKAVATLHGAFFRGKLLYVAIAERKEERQKKLQIHFANKMARSTSYSHPVMYPLQHYGQLKTCHPVMYPQQHCGQLSQGYRYLSPVPLYYGQQWAYPQCARNIWPRQVLYVYPQSIHTPMVEDVPTKSNENMSLESHKGLRKFLLSQSQRVPPRKVKISCPPEKQKQKTDEFKLKLAPKSLDAEVKKAVQLLESVKLDAGAVST